MNVCRSRRKDSCIWNDVISESSHFRPFYPGYLNVSSIPAFSPFNVKLFFISPPPSTQKDGETLHQNQVSRKECTDCYIFEEWKSRDALLGGIEREHSTFRLIRRGKTKKSRICCYKVETSSTTTSIEGERESNPNSWVISLMLFFPGTSDKLTRPTKVPFVSCHFPSPPSLKFWQVMNNHRENDELSTSHTPSLSGEEEEDIWWWWRWRWKMERRE